MPLWLNNGNVASNSVKNAARILSVGSGPTAIAANNTALFQNATPEAFTDNGGGTMQRAVGQFGWSTQQQANGGGENPKVYAPGWNIRRAGEGPVVSLTVNSAATSNSANGESILISNGAVNTFAIVTTNSSGNVTALTIGTPYGANSTWGNSVGGRFANSSMLAYSYTKEKHMMNITVTTPGANSTAQYSNTDTVSATNTTTNYVATLGTVNTTASGNVHDITITNVGLWSNVAANNGVVFTILAANGAASNGTGAVLTANLGISSNASAPITAAVMGGRAGRVTYECLAELSSLQEANCTQLPS